MFVFFKQHLLLLLYPSVLKGCGEFKCFIILTYYIGCCLSEKQIRFQDVPVTTTNTTNKSNKITFNGLLVTRPLACQINSSLINLILLNNVAEVLDV